MDQAEVTAQPDILAVHFDGADGQVVYGAQEGVQFVGVLAVAGVDVQFFSFVIGAPDAFSLRVDEPGILVA